MSSIDNTFVSAFKQFVNIQNDNNNLEINENGALLNKTSNNSLVDAFNKLVRKVTPENLSTYVNNIVADINVSKDNEILIDFFVLIFHKRNCRGGEGEKLITYQLLLEIYKTYPDIVCKVIEFLPFYGYYKDLFEIWELVCKSSGLDAEIYTSFTPLITAIVNLIVQQLKIDCNTIKTGNTNISLLAKWLPRHNNHYDKNCHWFFFFEDGPKKVNAVTYIAFKLFNTSYTKFLIPSNVNWNVMKYRKKVSMLTEKLNVAEVMMCAKKYSSIEFEKVASKAMKQYTKAFLNEKESESKYKYPETGNRYPTDKDRIECRKKLLEFIKEGKIDKIKGKQLEPYEILKALKFSDIDAEKTILESQWQVRKADVIQQCQQLLTESFNSSEENKSFTGIGKCIPMMDVSGSMMDGNPAPYFVGLSLGIMASELANDPYDNLAISFTETPRLFLFNNNDSLLDKVKMVENDHMGYSTNFAAAIDIILDLCITNKVPSNEIPNLLVFTDGQFDSMNKDIEINTYYYLYGNGDCSKINKSWKTCHQELMSKWANAGYDRIPTIIYWNLRANTPGIQTSSDHPGVQLLQGYSPALLKFVLFGEKMDTETVIVDNEHGTFEMKVSTVTPYTTMRKALDQDCYIPIRTMIEAMLDC
jgi:hypothetical protein